MHGSSQSVPLAITTMGGLVTLANPETVPEGASPRTYDTDYLVGSAKTRAGLTNLYPVVDETIGPQVPAAASSTTWVNPRNILVQDGIYTTTTPVNVPNALNVTQWTFDIPGTSGVTGILLTLGGFSNSPCNITAQLLIGGVPRGTIKTVALPNALGVVTLGATDDPWGLALTPDILNATTFGVQLTAASASFPLATAFLDYATLSIGVSTGAANFQFVTTFVAQNGAVKNLALDALGNFYVENVSTNPGVLTLIGEGITPSSYAVGVNGPDVEYLTFTDTHTGSDQPVQYTKNWVDRITQVGPGAAPVFTPSIATANTYPIVSITQPPAKSDPGDPGFINTLQQSAGPSSTAPGPVITVFYANSLDYGQDTTLVNAFNSGAAVYVYVSGTSLTAANGTFLVTSVGNAIPPGGSYYRWYFTYQVSSSAYQQFGGPDDSPGTYQQTLATITTSVPVPGLTVGNQITVSGASVTNWDNAWTISQALNSSQMVITGTQVTASVATYNYALSGGSTAAPAAGQLVTITGTANADGQLNLTNATIVSASGGSTGTFTVDVSVVTAPFAPEDGQATTAGTIFAFDPGLGTLGTTTSPIYGNSTGGTLTFTAPTAQLIGVGTRQGSVIFITRNGYYTAPAAPVTFSCPENTTAIIASQIPIGPPNVIARGILLTEPGQNGVPGANFFLLPTPVTYIVENVSYTATSFIINDNTSTTATLSFTDSVLLNSLAVDVYGYNLFNQIEIGDPGGVNAYDDRNCYIQCRNKVQNFNNLSFDGGYLPGGVLLPLGWSTPDVYGSLIVSAKFGNSYYINNTSGGTLAVAGLIQQAAFQDAYKQPIIQPNTAYSVRITAQIPSGNTGGNLVVSLVASGVTFGSFTLPFSEMSTQYAIYTGTLLTTEFLTTPSALMLVVQATEMAPGADVSIDRIDPYPTAIPILGTTEYWSYAGLPEQIDSVTGKVVYESENQQPVNGGIVLYDTHYALKGWSGNAPGSSLYSLQASSNLEPAQWQEPEVAQRSGGAIGPLAFDLAEQWFLGASRQGLYLFEGGQPGKINQEIYQIWDAINWAAGSTIWVKVDIIHRKILVGVPLPTPNFWLPNAPVNAAPSSPNVILMCNYQGIDTGQELKGMPQMHTTMFGTLNAIDMRRKWSIWQIPSPYANICQGATDEQLFICNGRANSKIYALDDAAATDDGIIIDSLYTTAGLPELSKRAQIPALGNSRVLFGYMSAALQSKGNVQVRLLPNRLLFPETQPVDNAGFPLYLDWIYETWTLPGGLTPGYPAMNDAEASLNFEATRTYVEFRENDGNGWSLSNLLLLAKKSVWQQFRGRTGL